MIEDISEREKNKVKHNALLFPHPTPMDSGNSNGKVCKASGTWTPTASEIMEVTARCCISGMVMAAVTQRQITGGRHSSSLSKTGLWHTCRISRITDFLLHALPQQAMLVLFVTTVLLMTLWHSQQYSSVGSKKRYGAFCPLSSRGTAPSWILRKTAHLPS